MSIAANSIFGGLGGKGKFTHARPNCAMLLRDTVIQQPIKNSCSYLALLRQHFEMFEIN